MKALTVTAVLAAAMLASGSSASADGGKGGKGGKWLPPLPAPAPLNLTWESAPSPGGGFSTLGITWE